MNSGALLRRFFQKETSSWCVLSFCEHLKIVQTGGFIKESHILL
jgi:hypothetical protein